MSIRIPRASKAYLSDDEPVAALGREGRGVGHGCSLAIHGQLRSVSTWRGMNGAALAFSVQLEGSTTEPEPAICASLTAAASAYHKT